MKPGFVIFIAILGIIAGCTSTATDNSGGGGGQGDISINRDGSSLNDGGSGGCRHGSVENCYSGPVKTKNVGICKEGKKYCIEGEWSGCEDEILPKSAEICGNNADDNCNGDVDEGCP
ncbi:MAG: hypothetical protein N3B13_11350, partial [Deltaproteobacteria bacterium]|nr:hypothetical protein [Deltaproteobacteria bacterium]